MINKVLQSALQQLLATMELVPRSKTLHHRIGQWAKGCLGAQQVASKEERAYRFFEEAVELARSAGLSEETAKQMVQAEYAKPTAGILYEEVGDVGIALSVLCIPYGIYPDQAMEDKLADLIPRSEAIRERQKRKRFRDRTV